MTEGLPLDLFLVSLVKGFQQFLRILSEKQAAMVGAFLGDAALLVLARRRKIALANARKINPALSDRQAKGVVRSCFRNLGINFVEMLFIPYVAKQDFSARFRMENVHHVEKASREGKGILALVFHYGNWEIMGVASHLLGREIIALARPLKGQKHLQEFINNLRAQTGLTVIPNQDTAKDAIRYLRENRIVAILGDQREKRSKGVYVELFGERVPTSKGIVALAMRTRSPVIPVYLKREGFLRYVIVYSEPLDIERGGNIEELLYKNTRKMNAFLESLVRTSPEEWFLVHRRFGRDAY